MTDDALPQTGTALGLVLGAGLATTVAVLLDSNLATITGFGVGGGLVVGAFAGTLARANRGRPRYAVRVVGGTVALGLLVGAGVGLAGAWGIDGALTDGLLLGAAVGVVHGALLGSILSARS